MNRLERIDQLMNEANKLAEEFVIEGAYVILKRCKALDELIIANGHAGFTVKGAVGWNNEVDLRNDPVYRNGKEYRAPDQVYTFLNHVEDLNDTFGVKGIGIRFRANSPIINDWGIVENVDDLYLTHEDA